jgi:AAA+ ATPase superfamily predicted ATPase
LQLIIGRCIIVTVVTVTVVTIMLFYDRDEELEILKKLDQWANDKGVMTVLTGRRRVGKTVLALHHAKGHRFLYLFVARKEEHLLCQEFLEEIKKHFQIPIIGEISSFQAVFSLLLEVAKKEKLTVIFDEFQEFFLINPSVYSEIQKLWDLNKHEIKMHAIFIGSVYSLMYKIFEDEKQPLFGRADRILHVKSFPLKTMEKILKQKKIFSAEIFFQFFVLTGGTPKYLDIFLNEKVTTFDEMLNVVLQKDSLFLNEGKNLLIEEFGKDYLTYFTILELISEGKTARSQMESLLEKTIGGYLHHLEYDYAIIARSRPINAKPNSRQQKYKIVDNFLNFWFRFIYRYRTAIEIENFSYIKQIIKRDYSTYCGPLLERFFQKLLAETGQYNQIGSYWEKDNRNEIDVVALNDLEKKILIAETKLNPSKINLTNLSARAESLLAYYSDYTPTFLGLTIGDVSSFL